MSKENWECQYKVPLCTLPNGVKLPPTNSFRCHNRNDIVLSHAKREKSTSSLTQFQANKLFCFHMLAVKSQKPCSKCLRTSTATYLGKAFPILCQKYSSAVSWSADTTHLHKTGWVEIPVLFLRPYPTVKLKKRRI